MRPTSRPGAAIRSAHALILLGGHTLRDRGLELAGRICSKNRRQAACPTGKCGAWSVARDASPSTGCLTLWTRPSAFLAGLKHIVLVGSKVPVAFFAYPDKPSVLVPKDCVAH